MLRNRICLHQKEEQAANRKVEEARKRAERMLSNKNEKEEINAKIQ